MTQKIAKPTKGLYWLASYPKSGNTWTRSFISAIKAYQAQPSSPSYDNINESQKEDQLALTDEGLIDINAISTGNIASARGWVAQILGFDISDLSQDELDQLRPDAYRWFVQQMQGIGYNKIHDAYTYLADGSPLIPHDAMLGALCIIRNPLDVAISFANHSSCSIDASIAMMANPDFAFCPGQIALDTQLRQWLLSWSDHVNSWTQPKTFKRLIVRYEDMKQTPLETFTAISDFLQLGADQKSISSVLEHIKIERFQKQEEQHGFVEKSGKVKRFFRKGIVGDWQHTLTPQQINRIINDHHAVMQKFGYLDSSGKPSSLIQAQA